MILLTIDLNEGIRVGPDVLIKFCRRPGTNQVSIGIQAPGGASGLRIERLDTARTADLQYQMSQAQPKGSVPPNLPPVISGQSSSSALPDQGRADLPVRAPHIPRRD